MPRRVARSGQKQNRGSKRFRLKNDRARSNLRRRTPSLPSRTQQHQRRRARVDVHRHGPTPTGTDHDIGPMPVKLRLGDANGRLELVVGQGGVQDRVASVKSAIPFWYASAAGSASAASSEFMALPPIERPPLYPSTSLPPADRTDAPARLVILPDDLEVRTRTRSRSLNLIPQRASRAVIRAALPARRVPRTVRRLAGRLSPRPETLRPTAVSFATSRPPHASSPPGKALGRVARHPLPLAEGRRKRYLRTTWHSAVLPPDNRMLPWASIPPRTAPMSSVPGILGAAGRSPAGGRSHVGPPGTDAKRWSLQRAELASSCWTMTPRSFCSGSRTTAWRRCPSNPQAASGRHLFSRQAPHPAGWLPSSCGGWS